MEQINYYQITDNQDNDKKPQGKMKRSIYKTRKTILSIILLLLLCNMINAQGNTIRRTTSTEKNTSQKMKSEEDKKRSKKNKKEEESSSTDKLKKSDSGISGSKGARPPYIARPSGSGITRGSGRPGAAIRPGRR